MLGSVQGRRCMQGSMCWARQDMRHPSLKASPNLPLQARHTHTHAHAHSARGRPLSTIHASCVCVCVRVYEKERERARESERGRARERRTWRRSRSSCRRKPLSTIDASSSAMPRFWSLRLWSESSSSTLALSEERCSTFSFSCSAAAVSVRVSADLRTYATRALKYAGTCYWLTG